jgi:hypothetical protein
MSPARSNHYLLGFWAGAHAALSEAALPPLGLSTADIDAMLTVEPAVLQHWAERPDSIVRPRPGLLPALQANDQTRIAAFVGDHGGGDCTIAVLLLPPVDRHALARLLRAVNQHLLTVWQQAAGDDEQAERMALSSTDQAALAAADERTLTRWSQLPITLAEPRPGLLPALLAREEPQLAAFLSSFGPMSTAP